MSARTVEVPSGATAVEAAEDALSAAALSDCEVRTEFNGTPMVAYPSDQGPQVVFLRWHYERLIIQIREGVIRAEDVRLS